MPRVIYAMASDGLIFRFLSYVNERFKTPLTATITAGIMAGKRDTYLKYSPVENYIIFVKKNLDVKKDLSLFHFSYFCCDIKHILVNGEFSSLIFARCCSFHGNDVRPERIS